MKLNWEKYFYGLWSAALQNVGTVGAVWLTMNGLNSAGADVPKMNLKALGWSLLVAGVLPAIFKFWQKQPLPDIEETTVTITTTKTKGQTDEIKPSDSASNPSSA